MAETIELQDILGSIAAFLTTISFLPQAIKVIREQNTDGISLSMYVIFTAGVAGWLFYGLLLNEKPIIIANAVTLILAAIILTVKVKNTIKKRHTRNS